jgi:D-xylose transport system permease protein
VTTTTGPAEEPQEPSVRHLGARLRGLVAATEIDLRLFGMVAALIAILAVFGIMTGGRILSPSNLVTMSVQAASVAIISTGMVIIIVSRNIDLSVGSIVGVTAMTYALLMTGTGILTEVLGRGHPATWIIALGIGLLVGALIGALQGFIVAYVGVPSFIVTLGGLLALRGVVWIMSGGQGVAGLDLTFQILGGGPQGSIGGPLSWVVGIVACIGIVALLLYSRRQRRKFGFPLRPRWAEVLIGLIGCLAALGLVFIANSYLWPQPLAERWAEENGVPIPPGGLRIESGIPWPILLLIIVALVMSFLANRRRFGRYIYAIGGNPEAAELAGINTRLTVLKSFALMGVLCALSGAVAAARLNAASLDVGRGYELYVIAATVIGGTSLSGGIGTIPGAILGALVMATLAYGLQYIGLSSPYQDIAAGIVLIAAVGLDSWNRRRAT